MAGRRVRGGRMEMLAGVMMVIGAAAGCGGGGGNGGGGGGGGGGPTGPPPVTAGTISGTVSVGGTGVSGAQVALAGGGTQTTSGSGQYTFNNVSAGSHSLTLTVPAGFALATGETASKPANVTAGQTSTVNWSLTQLTGPPQTLDVSMLAASFSPSDITVPRGATVRWTNQDAIAHTITPASTNPGGGFSNQQIPAQSGFTFQHTFASPGVFSYNCTLHAGMSGVVRVP